jgi:hypothetical protein
MAKSKPEPKAGHSGADAPAQNETTRINYPGAPTNTPQHLLGQDSSVQEGHPEGQTAVEGRTVQSGSGTSSASDVADPHPSDEEHYDRIPRPGGTNPPERPSIGPNPGRHDGAAGRPPRNVETEGDTRSPDKD